MPTNGDLDTLTLSSSFPDTRPVHAIVEYSEVDRRGAIALRVRVGSDGAMQPTDPGGGSQGGRWTEALCHCYDMPRDASALEVEVQAEKLRWSDRTNVYSTSRNWADMTFQSKTAKKLVLTQEMLEASVVVFGVWYGRAKANERPDQQEPISGKILFKDTYEDEDGEDSDDDDESDDGDRVQYISNAIAFQMKVVMSDTSDRSTKTLTFPKKDITTQHIGYNHCGNTAPGIQDVKNFLMLQSIVTSCDALRLSVANSLHNNNNG